MKKIAYIEIDTHAEIALNFMELMQDSQQFTVDYYFSEKIVKQLGLQESKNIKIVNSKNLKSQISNLKFDLVIIGTVHRYFHVFEKITEQLNTAIVCHNLNFVNTTKWDLLSAVFKVDFQYRLKLLLKESLLKKSKVYQKAKHLLVLDQSLEKENYKLLPIFYTKFSSKPENENLMMVIPGAVSQNRRDYFSALKKLKDVKLEKFTIVFLGKAKGKELEWLQNFEKSKPENASIKYFTEKVPQNIFEEYMQKADFLWCPIQEETEFFSQMEMYGITKMSGNIGDAIKFSKCAVFPEEYPSNYSFIIPEKSGKDFIFAHKEVDFSPFQKQKIQNDLENSILNLI